MAKTEADAGTAAVETRYTKAELLRSAKYAKRRDLLSAILKEGDTYTISDVDKAVNKFMKGVI